LLSFFFFDQEKKKKRIEKNFLRKNSFRSLKLRERPLRVDNSENLKFFKYHRKVRREDLEILFSLILELSGERKKIAKIFMKKST